MQKLLTTVCKWFDTNHMTSGGAEADKKVDWLRCIPFIGLHLMCLGVIWVGWSPIAVLTAVFLYFARMFAITGFYHRYFSHRTFKTSRWFQLVMAIWGATAVQRGPLWWAAHHRHHHRYSDEPQDVHSPRQHGFLWSHMGWFTTKESFPTKNEYISDLNKFPELVLLNRFDIVVPFFFALGLFFFGKVIGAIWPSTGVSGMQMLIWGFFISTIATFHGTYCINSLAHVFGRRRFPTNDDSRNSFLLALITLGEGWHNNHHHYPHSVRQGFYWWELDITFYILKLFSWMGLVWDLRPVPVELKDVAAAQRSAA